MIRVARCMRDALWKLPGGAVAVVLHGGPVCSMAVPGCLCWGIKWLWCCLTGAMHVLTLGPRAVARYSRITFAGAIVAPHCRLPGLQEPC